MTDVTEILKEHVTLDIECIDRLYLNGYIPTMQSGGQLVRFLHHLGAEIPSPVLLGRMTAKYRETVKRFAEQQEIPMIQFERGQRKDDIAATYREQFTGHEGVYLIGVAQERASAFKSKKRTHGQAVGFDYTRQSVFVNHYYFYFLDEDFGPAFIKVCSYAPYPVKVCINGHEWAKRQAQKASIEFEALDNGFLSCSEPERLQAICDELGPEQIQVFFDKWQNRLPWRLTPEDQAAGFRYRLSIWQAEFSRTQVFADSAQGRQWFEAIIRDNLDVGRPDRIQLVFERRVTKATPGLFRTQVVQEGVNPSLHAYYKKSHVKQYFKEERALRTETTINNTKDFGVNKDISNLPYLQQLGRTINRRLLDAQHTSFTCTLSSQSLERLVQPTVTNDGQQAPALRLGHPRVMALLNALTSFAHLPRGLSNRSLRPQVADLLGLDPDDYSSAQMSYDLRRLRLKGLIARIPKSYRYVVTTYGQHVALLLSKLHSRIFRPALAALDPQQPLTLPLKTALDQVDAALDLLVNQAEIGVSTS